jgi:dynactin complex subunit
MIVDNQIFQNGIDELNDGKERINIKLVTLQMMDQILINPIYYLVFIY